MMTPCSIRCSEHQPANGIADETIVHMVVFIALAFFIELGPNRFSRLLDAITDTEYFRELTMID